MRVYHQFGQTFVRTTALAFVRGNTRLLCSRTHKHPQSGLSTRHGKAGMENQGATVLVSGKQILRVANALHPSQFPAFPAVAPDYRCLGLSPCGRGGRRIPHNPRAGFVGRTVVR